MRVFIITGTSRGIGAALSKSLLHENHCVVCLSRSENIDVRQFALKNNYRYVYYNCELTELARIPQLIMEITDRLEVEMIESIGLVNNAAVVIPLKPIDQCEDMEIIHSLHTNMLAPILLTKHFINQTDDWSVPRTVINISTGSANNPAAGMGLYCGTKAGLRMFTQCISKEQGANGVRLVSFDPGMVETGMQLQARSSNEDDFPLSKFFRERKESGRLKSVEQVASELTQVLLEPH